MRGGIRVVLDGARCLYTAEVLDAPSKSENAAENILAPAIRPPPPIRTRPPWVVWIRRISTRNPPDPHHPAPEAGPPAQTCRCSPSPVSLLFPLGKQDPAQASCNARVLSVAGRKFSDYFRRTVPEVRKFPRPRSSAPFLEVSIICRRPCGSRFVWRLVGMGACTCTPRKLSAPSGRASKSENAAENFTTVFFWYLGCCVLGGAGSVARPRSPDRGWCGRTARWRVGTFVDIGTPGLASQSPGSNRCLCVDGARVHLSCQLLPQFTRKTRIPWTLTAASCTTLRIANSICSSAPNA